MDPAVLSVPISRGRKRRALGRRSDFVYLKVSLAVFADGAHLGGLGAHHDVAADTALPHGLAALFKYLLHPHVVQQLAVTLLMALFDGAHHAEPVGQVMEAFFVRVPGHPLIHIRPLIVLALGGGKQILGRGADVAQLLEPDPGMLLLVAGSLQEQLRQLLIALLLGHQREEGVLVPGLALSREGLLQVFLRLGARVDRRAGSGSLLHLLKSGDRLLADGAFEVRGQLLPLGIPNSSPSAARTEGDVLTMTTLSGSFTAARTAGYS